MEMKSDETIKNVTIHETKSTLKECDFESGPNLIIWKLDGFELHFAISHDGQTTQSMIEIAN